MRICSRPGFRCRGWRQSEGADLGGLDGSDGTDHRIIFDVFVDLCLFSDSGSVDKVEVKTEFVVACIYRIARCAGYIGHDIALFAYESVYNGVS